MWEKIYAVTDFLWGTPLMILMVGVGFYLSLRTGFFQITGIRTWWKATVGEILGKTKTSDSEGAGEMKPFQAMATVMAGTVGSGNIAGVATAIAAGGPGAVFWMWIISLVGMMTKMAEVTLSVAYRKKNEDGEYFGGPMHYMKTALGKAGAVLAGFYAVALLIEVLADACFVQTNTLAVCVNDVYGIPMVPIAVVVVGISALIIFTGGVKKIGDFCGKMVPAMVAVYIVSCIIVIGMNAARIPSAFAMIIQYAFKPAPAVGGFLGSTVSLAMARGAARGIFSNEAGMGTAGIAHGTAAVAHPAEQGMMGIMEVFLDTIVICTLTALVILVSGVPIPYGTDAGGSLTSDAFSAVCGGWSTLFLAVSICCFALATVLGWGLYGLRCARFLLGKGSEKWFVLLQMGASLLGTVLKTGVIWTMAETVNGFMAIPNLLALACLSGEVVGLTREYMQQKSIGR